MVFTEDMLVDAGLTQDQADEGAVEAWQMHVAARKALLDKKARELSESAYKEKDVKNPVGTLIAEFDLEEYLWLKLEYGEECVKDRQFLHDYKKHRDQTFLPDLSKSWH